MEFNFTLNENDIKIITAYGALAIHALQNSANKEDKIKDLDLKFFTNEVETMCKVYWITTAIEKSKELIND